MSDRELSFHLDDDDDFSDSDFSDGYDRSLGLELEGNDVPYITSPVFPDLPKLKYGKHPWRVNANGIQICDVAVGNDFDFAETTEIGLQADNEGQYFVDSDETDDEEFFNEIDPYGKVELTENKTFEEIHNGEESSEESKPEAYDKTTTHDLIEAVHASNVQINSNFGSPGSQTGSSNLRISEEFDSKYSLSDTDIECDEDSSESVTWQQQEIHYEENRRWIGVSPAKFRLLRRGFYD